MNILITPNFQTLPKAKQNFSNKSTFISPKYSHTLVRDTVSFSGKIPPKASNKIGEVIEKAYVSGEKQFLETAKKFHVTLKKVAQKLESDGFSYDGAYNSKHPVKSLNSFIDKYQRQGYVQDTIRGTVYWTDQQNIASFKKFLDAMKEEGYEMAVIKKVNPNTGKLEKYPDLEIRQNGITVEDLAPLGSFLQKSDISKPRSSTYSDFQMRFVPIKSAGKNENKTTLEVIMLYGPHYSKAKELESKYVYNIARSLEKLHVNLDEKYAEKTPGRRIVNNIDSIKTRLREFISKALFTNAYNADLKIYDAEKIPVVIPKVYTSLLDGYMSGIREKIPMYYRNLNKQIKHDECIIQIIKDSTGYKMRADKTITPEEIKDTRARLKMMIPVYEAEDIGTISTAQEMLKTTIAKFGEK